MKTKSVEEFVVCKICKQSKPKSDYYKSKNLLSGHFKECKKCWMEIIRVNKLKSYDPAKQRVRTAKRIESGKAAADARRMYQKHRHKALARAALKWEIRMGRMKRLPCVECGAEKTEGHHTDYSKPLDVVWLCKKHHMFLHRKQPLLHTPSAKEEGCLRCKGNGCPACDATRGDKHSPDPY